MADPILRAFVHGVGLVGDVDRLKYDAELLGDLDPEQEVKLGVVVEPVDPQGASPDSFVEIGEPDFVTPQPVIDAGMQALSEGRTHYTPAVGLPALRERFG